MTCASLADKLNGGHQELDAAGQEVSKGQRGAAERQFPFNSYAGVRTMIRYLVNAPD